MKVTRVNVGECLMAVGLSMMVVSAVGLMILAGIDLWKSLELFGQ